MQLKEELYKLTVPEKGTYMTNQKTKLTRQDLKIFPSENLTDYEDGGGLPIATPLEEQARELFTPVTSVDNLNGSFNARLVYVGVNRDDDEPLYGSFFGITARPSNEDVSYIAYPATEIGTTLSDLHEDYQKSWKALYVSDPTIFATDFFGIKKIKNAITTNDRYIYLTKISETMAENSSTNGHLSFEKEGSSHGIGNGAELRIFKVGSVILIASRVSESIGHAHTNGQIIQLSRNNLDRICLTDANNTQVSAELWDYDLAEGTIKWQTPLDLSAYEMPITAHHSQEELNVITELNNTWRLTLKFPCKHDYSIDNTYVSSLIETGTLQVRHSKPFSQRNWTGEWSDTKIGDASLNKLNIIDYPMTLTSKGTLTERYLIKFVTGSQFELYGENLGYLGEHDTLTDLAPINPSTQVPLFFLHKESFGNESPWASQDVIRFNTYGTLVPIWLIRLVQPNRNEQTEPDGFKMCLFGDTTEIIN